MFSIFKQYMDKRVCVKATKLMKQLIVEVPLPSSVGSLDILAYVVAEHQLNLTRRLFDTLNLKWKRLDYLTLAALSISGLIGVSDREYELGVDPLQQKTREITLKLWNTYRKSFLGHDSQFTTLSPEDHFLLQLNFLAIAHLSVKYPVDDFLILPTVVKAFLSMVGQTLTNNFGETIFVGNFKPGI